MANLLPQDVAALSPEEQLKKLLASSSVPTTPGGAPLGQGVGGGPAESISPYDPRATALAAPAVDGEAQEFGLSRMEAPNQTSGELLSSQADIHNNKAMSLLQKALESQSEVSPSQALAAGVLALVPTLGGYMAGKSVGSPELSPHLRLSLDQLQKGMTGGAQGGLTGLGAGAQASSQYLTGIDKQFQERQQIMGEQAGLEAKLGNQYTNANLQNQMGEMASKRGLENELILQNNERGLDMQAMLTGAATGDPSNPIVKARLEQEKYKTTQLDELQKRFQSLPEVQNFASVEKSVGWIMKAIESGTAVSDLELVRLAILAIEPGMAVREGEQAAVSKSQNITGQMKGAMARTLGTGAALGPQIREELKGLAKRAYDSTRSQYDRAKDFYSREMEYKGLDPKRLTHVGTPQSPIPEDRKERAKRIAAQKVAGEQISEDDADFMAKLTLETSQFQQVAPTL